MNNTTRKSWMRRRRKMTRELSHAAQKDAPKDDETKAATPEKATA